MKAEEFISKALAICSDRIYAVPGWPITNISSICNAEIVVNEKVGLEYAIGSSLSGNTAALIMKHEGLNVCADLLLHSVPQGLRKGVVLVVGDDVRGEFSLTSQDSRYYGELAEIPVIQPVGEQCGMAITEAFNISARFSRPVIIRLTPSFLSSDIPDSKVFRSDEEGELASADYPLISKILLAKSRSAEMFKWASGSGLNKFGDCNNYQEIITMYPPPGPEKIPISIKEEGRPFLLHHRCITPELTDRIPETYTERGYYRTLCKNCPFHPLFLILKEKNRLAVCDAGCSVLALNPPLRLGIASYGLGNPVGIAAESTGLALLGDYGVLHNALPSLVDVFEKGKPVLCVILKNRVMGMTGGQKGFDPAPYLSFTNPVQLHAEDVNGLKKHLELEENPKVVIVEGECPEGRSHEIVQC